MTKQLTTTEERGTAVLDKRAATARLLTDQIKRVPAVNDGDGEMQFVRLSKALQPNRSPADEEIVGNPTPRKRRRVQKKITTETFIDEEEIEPAIVHHTPRSDNRVSDVLGQMFAAFLAVVAALFGTGALFAVVNSHMPVFFVCLVLGVVCGAGFVSARESLRA